MKAVLQICQNYQQPFLDCTRQYTALFSGSDYKVVTVFVCGEKNEAVALEASADEVIFLGHHRDELKGLKLNILREIKAITEQYDFNLCIAHRNKSTYLALMGTKLPVFSIHHAFGDFDRLGRRLMARFFGRRLTLFAVSNAVREEIDNKLPGWPSEQLLTLYNRIDAAQLRQQLVPRAKARSLLSLPPDAYIVANVGRLHPDKDQTTLIKGFAKAIQQLPDLSYLVILGKGNYEQKLRSLSEKLGVASRVIFTGHVPDAKTLFRAFDLFILTSDHEPFGMVLLEAMAANIPVICSNSGGGPEVVDGVGELFENGNADDLAKKIISSVNMASTNNLSAQNEKRLILFSDENAKKTFWTTQAVQKFLAIPASKKTNSN